MNPDAKVKLRGVEVGKVASIEERAEWAGGASTWRWILLAGCIPANVAVDIASTTVFGAKYVQLVPPADAPLRNPMRAGQVIACRSTSWSR